MTAQVYEFTMPLRTISEANDRAHWRARHERHRDQRLHTSMWMRKMLHRDHVKLSLPAVVTLTRIAHRKLDDGDNLPMSLKHVRDEIAAQLGVDDANPLITYQYKQEKCLRGKYGVRVNFEVKK